MDGSEWLMLGAAAAIAAVLIALFAITDDDD